MKTPGDILREREAEIARDLVQMERDDENTRKADNIIACFIGLILGFCLGLWRGMP